MELTEKQIKTRWSDLKKTIRNRPLLAYQLQIPLNEWNKYMHSTPERKEVNRIYDLVQEDRKLKTTRIREKLKDVVGYRETNIYAEYIDISTTTLKLILDKKNKIASYDLINRIELFLNATDPEFIVSIENPLSFEAFLDDELRKYAFKISGVANNINSILTNILDLQNFKENIDNEFLIGYQKPNPITLLYRYNSTLQYEIQKLETVYNIYIKNRK